MDLDSRYTLVREKLYTLGFNQQLPIGALSLVSAILDDLLKTTDNFKKSKETVKQLLEEKVAWELGIEPYKCDNSRLLSECNSLHMEILKLRDTNRIKVVDLNRVLRNLEVDKRYLEEHCTELIDKIRELERQLNELKGFSKTRKDGENLYKKPFISTVRSSAVFPKPLKPIGDNMCNGDRLPYNCAGKSKTKDGSVHIEIQRLENDIRTQMDTIEAFKKQLESRDREISRLQQLLIGGRPTSALGKDCCYRGVGTLAEDVESLQKEKIAAQNQLKECVSKQHEAMQRAIELGEQLDRTEKEMGELEKVALTVESEANVKLVTKDKQISKLETKLNESLQKIAYLEAAKHSNTHDEHKNQNFRIALKQMNDEKENLEQKLKIMTKNENDLQTEVDRLNKKNLKIKQKLMTTMKNAEQSDNFKNNLPNEHHVIDTNRIKSERDFFQAEYLKLQNQTTFEKELEAAERKLAMRQQEIDELRQKLETQLNNGNIPYSSRSVQSTIQRMEREKCELHTDLDRLLRERDDLRQRLQLLTELHRDEQSKTDHQMKDLLTKMSKLESDNRMLISTELPNRTTITVLREENAKQKNTIQSLERENSKSRTSYNQLKILQDQTERALLDHENRLTVTAAQLNRAESKLSSDDARQYNYDQNIHDLQDEKATLKILNLALEHEKNELLNELETTRQQLYALETNLCQSKTEIQDMAGQIEMLQRRLEDTTCENNQREGTIRKVTSDSDTLRNQFGQLKRNYENALSENSRLLKELSNEGGNQCNMRRKLAATEKEVERLKQQLQQYVQEVERAEHLLMKKEEERDEMLDHYKSLSHDAVVLEGTNHSLELEANQAKRQLDEAEAKIAELQKKLTCREQEITNYESQIAALTRQVESLELEVETCREERTSMQSESAILKDLCNKLDIEKDKIKAELTECLDIRKKLEKENEKLRKTSTAAKTGDKVAVDSLQDLLAVSRQELEQHRIANVQQEKELKKLKTRVDDLQTKLDEEHSTSMQNEALSKEYSLQIEKLRHRLMEDRFASAVSKEGREDYDRLDENSKKFKNTASSARSESFESNSLHTALKHFLFEGNRESSKSSLLSLNLSDSEISSKASSHKKTVSIESLNFEKKIQKLKKLPKPNKLKNDKSSFKQSLVVYKMDQIDHKSDKSKELDNESRKSDKLNESSEESLNNSFDLLENTISSLNECDMSSLIIINEPEPDIYEILSPKSDERKILQPLEIKSSKLGIHESMVEQERIITDNKKIKPEISTPISAKKLPVNSKEDELKDLQLNFLKNAEQSSSPNSSRCSFRSCASSSKGTADKNRLRSLKHKNEIAKSLSHLPPPPPYNGSEPLGKYRRCSKNIVNLSVTSNIGPIVNCDAKYLINKEK